MVAGNSYIAWGLMLGECSKLSRAFSVWQCVALSSFCVAV